MNILYHADNLEILKSLPDNSVDLIYIDPPFNTKRKHTSSKNKEAFNDVWIAHTHTIHPDNNLFNFFSNIITDISLLNYLAMMYVRLIELHRILKPTGSIYVHVDVRTVHHLKIIMDTIWGIKNFRSEIIWKRHNGHGNTIRTYGKLHDTILYYTKTTNYTYNGNVLVGNDSDEYIQKRYPMIDENGKRFESISLLNPNSNRPNLVYEFHGITRTWRWTKERMLKAETNGELYFPKKEGGIPRWKKYADEVRNIKLSDVWDDIGVATRTERMDYPTQKPLALLERIIKVSSNEGDVVLDCFAGSGTTLIAAQKLNRQWIGIDSGELAVETIVKRMCKQFPNTIFDVV